MLNHIETTLAEIFYLLYEFIWPYYSFFLIFVVSSFFWYWLLERNFFYFINFLYYPKTIQMAAFIWTSRRARFGAHVGYVLEAVLEDFDFLLGHLRTQLFVEEEEDRAAYDRLRFSEWDDGDDYIEFMRTFDYAADVARARTMLANIEERVRPEREGDEEERKKKEAHKLKAEYIQKLDEAEEDLRDALDSGESDVGIPERLLNPLSIYEKMTYNDWEIAFFYFVDDLGVSTPPEIVNDKLKKKPAFTITTFFKTLESPVDIDEFSTTELPFLIDNMRYEDKGFEVEAGRVNAGIYCQYELDYRDDDYDDRNYVKTWRDYLELRIGTCEGFFVVYDDWVDEALLVDAHESVGEYCWEDEPFWVEDFIWPRRLRILLSGQLPFTLCTGRNHLTRESRILQWTANSIAEDGEMPDDDEWFEYLKEQKEDQFKLFNRRADPAFVDYDWVQRLGRVLGIRYIQWIYTLRPLREAFSNTYVFDILNVEKEDVAASARRFANLLNLLKDALNKDCAAGSGDLLFKTEQCAKLAEDLPTLLEEDPGQNEGLKDFSTDPAYHYIHPMIFTFGDERFKAVVPVFYRHIDFEPSLGNFRALEVKKRRAIRREFAHVNTEWNRFADPAENLWQKVAKRYGIETDAPINQEEADQEE